MSKICFFPYIFWSRELYPLPLSFDTVYSRTRMSPLLLFPRSWCNTWVSLPTDWYFQYLSEEKEPSYDSCNIAIFKWCRHGVREGFRTQKQGSTLCVIDTIMDGLKFSSRQENKEEALKLLGFSVSRTHGLEQFHSRVKSVKEFIESTNAWKHGEKY